MCRSTSHFMVSRSSSRVILGTSMIRTTTVDWPATQLTTFLAEMPPPAKRRLMASLMAALSRMMSSTMAP